VVRPAAYADFVRTSLKVSAHPLDFAQAARALAPAAEHVASNYVEASPERQEAVIAEAQAEGPAVLATLTRIAIAHERHADAAERSAHAHERMAQAAENAAKPRVSPWEWLVRGLLLLAALADLVQIFGADAVRDALKTLEDLLSQRPPGPGL
jgi:hypothetical protein